MLGEFPLTVLDSFAPPRLGEAARRRVRAGIGMFCALVAVLGIVPAGLLLTSPAGAGLWLIVLAGAVATTVTGLVLRASVLALTGVTSVSWLVTGATAMTVLGGLAYRCLLLAVVGWMAVVWWRAATPGRVIRDGRVDVALRRFFARLGR